MDFPPDWLVVAEEDFETATPRDPGFLGMEILAQLRPNGRIMDHFRVVLGGHRPTEATFLVKDIFSIPNPPEMSVKLQQWPRDISIRRNMCSSEWLDLPTLIAANEALVYDLNDGAGGSTDDVVESPCNNVLLEFLDGLPDRLQWGASVRWVVGVGPDSRMELTLQGLPASATVLNGKPTFRG